MTIESLVLNIGIGILGAFYMGPYIGLRTSLNPKRRVHKISEDLIIPTDATSLEYLNLANSQMHQGDIRGYDCKHKSRTTFDLYQQLVEKYDRRDLEGHVMLCAGLIEKKKQGHNWIDVKIDEEWRPYETTIRTPQFTSFDQLRRYTNSEGKIHFIDEELKRNMILQNGKVYPTPRLLKGALCAFF